MIENGELRKHALHILGTRQKLLYTKGECIDPSRITENPSKELVFGQHIFKVAPVGYYGNTEFAGIPLDYYIYEAQKPEIISTFVLIIFCNLQRYWLYAFGPNETLSQKLNEYQNPNSI